MLSNSNITREHLARKRFPVNLQGTGKLAIYVIKLLKSFQLSSKMAPWVPIHLSLSQASKVFRIFFSIPDYICNACSVFTSIISSFVFTYILLSRSTLISPSNTTVLPDYVCRHNLSIRATPFIPMFTK